MDNRDDSGRRQKKQKTIKKQYMLWWVKNGIKHEYGPSHCKKSTKRDAFFYEKMCGKGNAGWEDWEDPRMKRRREREDRQNKRYQSNDDDY